MLIRFSEGCCLWQAAWRRIHGFRLGRVVANDARQGNAILTSRSALAEGEGGLSTPRSNASGPENGEPCGSATRDGPGWRSIRQCACVLARSWGGGVAFSPPQQPGIICACAQTAAKDAISCLGSCGCMSVQSCSGRNACERLLNPASLASCLCLHVSPQAGKYQAIVRVLQRIALQLRPVQGSYDAGQ